MREQRGKQAAASFLFKLAESVGTQGISFVVSVVLAGAAIYGGLALLLRLESMRYLMDMLRGLAARRRGEAKA